MHLKTLFILLLFITPKTVKLPENFCAKVIGVIDGDTIEVLYENKPIHIRLAHIDCPEKKQPFGKKSKQFVSNEIFGKKVKIIHSGKWHWNRLIAEVYYDNNKNLNKELISNGLAMHFKKYSKDKKYSELEIEAKNSKIGIWSDPSLISPWEYRRGGKKRKSIEKLYVSKQKIIKMRKIIPFMLIGFALTAFQEKEVKKVFICKSVASKRYHLKKTCKGLKMCKTEVKMTTVKKAERLGRILCKFEKKQLEKK
ncbi:thermonuclease family protein [Tenacibaculum ovolyticum]|uniref:thermonuclease family protein n=1 Tax=Tenacibaculum ovolyticum TaxID=104270 RepID=UPI0022F3C48A|nr:thermonuclease family protein [Tenacibaculum ovolyticum]WBX78031.1 thermonuclease family protein [Tenacibaculum ovolyticum]